MFSECTLFDLSLCIKTTDYYKMSYSIFYDTMKAKEFDFSFSFFLIFMYRYYHAQSDFFHVKKFFPLTKLLNFILMLRLQNST